MISTTVGKGQPRVAVVACIHGNELYGKEVLGKLKKIKVCKGSVVSVFANRKAYCKKKRFIDCDLNRSFPGSKDGNYEQQQALKILEVLKNCDIVIDLHSSSTPTPPFIVLSKITRKHLEFLPKVPIDTVVYMPKSVACGKALIDYCKCGVSLEMGLHTKSGLSDYAFGVLKGILAGLGVVKYEKQAATPKKLFVVHEAAQYTKKSCRKRLNNFTGFREKGKTVYPILITPKKRALDGIHFLKATTIPYSLLNKVKAKHF